MKLRYRYLKWITSAFQPVGYGKFVENLILMCAKLKMRKNAKKNSQELILYLISM